VKNVVVVSSGSDRLTAHWLFLYIRLAKFLVFLEQKIVSSLPFGLSFSRNLDKPVWLLELTRKTYDSESYLYCVLS